MTGQLHRPGMFNGWGLYTFVVIQW